MDTLLAVLRPKNTVTVLSEYRPRNFDLLLLDIRTSSTDKSKTLKNLPKLTGSTGQDITKYSKDFLYQLTGAENGGIKGKQSIHIPTQPSSDKEVAMVELHCLIVDSKAKLNATHVDNIPSTPGFYQLDYVIDSCKKSSAIYSRHTRSMVNQLDRWLAERYSIPNAMDTLLSSSAQTRVKRSVHNPVYASKVTPSGSQSLDRSQITANELLTKMMAIEKCDIVIMNNLFGASHVYKHRVDAIAVNHFWGMGVPDTDRMSLTSRSQWNNGSMDSGFPLHESACKGEVSQVQRLLHSDIQLATTLDRNLWAPIHYAACYGHVAAVKVLVEEGHCSPNVLTDNLSTPLHFAAVHGQPSVVRYLLDSKNIDVNALDKDGRSALDLCVKSSRANYKECARLLKEARERPYQKIVVHLMDKQTQVLDLVSGDNTTAQQLNLQISKNLGLPQECHDMFTIWICSRNLQLQLKWDHRPKQHLTDWRNIVKMYTDFDPTEEEPKLCWKRDARLSVTKERKNRHIVATHLLFHEAYTCYIKGYYPCAEEDAIILGAVVMLLDKHTDESKKVKSILFEKNIRHLVPESLMKYSTKSTKYWSSKIQSKYKSLTSQLSSPATVDLQYYFLLVCWNLKVYGSAFFSGFLQTRAGSNQKSSSSSSDFVHVGINDIGVHIIHGQSKMMIHTFDYNSIKWSEWRPSGGFHQYLKITPKNAPRGQSSIIIRSKQSELVVQLMTMLHDLHKSN